MSVKKRNAWKESEIGKKKFKVGEENDMKRVKQIGEKKYGLFV